MKKLVISSTIVVLASACMIDYTEGVEAYTVSEYNGFEVLGMFANEEEGNRHDIDLMAYTTWAIAYQWEEEEMRNPEKVRDLLSVATFYVVDPSNDHLINERGTFDGVNVESNHIKVYGHDTPMVYVSRKYWNSVQRPLRLLSHEFLHTAIYKIFEEAKGPYGHEEPFGRGVNPVWFEYWENSEDRTHTFGPELFEYRVYCRAIWAIIKDGHDFHPSDSTCDDNFNKMGMSDPFPVTAEFIPPAISPPPISPVVKPNLNLNL